MQSQFINIQRIEFIITWQCGGKCKHCQVGDAVNQHSSHRHVFLQPAVEAVKKISTAYDVTSVMTFGGEPLFYPNVTAAIHSAAAQCGVPSRQLITSGYFTNNASKSQTVANALAQAGVNHLLLSVDAFHQEHIPFEPVYRFACDVINATIPGAALYPAWLVNKEHQNPYNTKTKELLTKFSELSIPVSPHENRVTLLGQAATSFRHYVEVPELTLSQNEPAPCTELLNVTNISIVPNGDVMVCGFVIGNIYQEDVLDVLARYNPYENKAMLALIQGGVTGLLDFAAKQGVVMDTSAYCDACDVCAAVTKRLAL
jgi:MoaA/NifB/PqqE/SkfB family radical SAM enzyme